MNLLDQIKENGIVAVIRGATSKNIFSIANALKRGGVKTIEITVESPKVLPLIQQVSEEFGRDVIVGAGTVLDSETARAAIIAGAKFIFSPTVDVETIKMARRYGVLSVPGALTPTEILTAYENGADLIKVFPANVFGPSYIKDVHGPLPHIPLMPTGGVTLDNIGDFIRAGAVAAGIGSSLVNTTKTINEDYLVELESIAAQFTEVIQKERKRNSVNLSVF